MTYWEMKIWLKGKKKPLCTALFESKQKLDEFMELLQSDIELVQLGEVAFMKEDFHYAEIKERHIRA